LARLPLRAAGAAARTAGTALGAIRHPGAATDTVAQARAMAEVLVQDELTAAPQSSINVPIGGKRRLAFASFSLGEIKEVKSTLGGTVNDVVLAMSAGALRKLLIERGEPLPPPGLRAMVPMNVREAGEHLALGNRISSLFVHLPVAVPDPLERYRRQVDEAEGLKSGRQALGSSALVDLTAHAPPILHSFLARSLFATRLFNLTITNVPGPQVPLYAFGTRMREVWPLVPLASEHAVALAIFSYDGTVFFCLNADLDAMHDLDVLVRGLEESYAELRSAVTRNVRRHAGAAPRSASRR
jgi:WS/DGAT/MGAT family acyltransferase